MIIQVDVDSTLYDANILFAEVAKEHFGIDLPLESDNWHGYFDHANAATLSKIFRKAHSEAYVRKQNPYPGAAEVVKSLHERGHDVFVVSDRHPQTGNTLRQWVLDKDILTSYNINNVIVGKDKREWMRTTRPDIVIDDRVRTMTMARFELGSTVFSLAQPWNVNLLNEVDGIYICMDWEEIGEKIERYL